MSDHFVLIEQWWKCFYFAFLHYISRYPIYLRSIICAFSKRLGFECDFRFGPQCILCLLLTLELLKKKKITLAYVFWQWSSSQVSESMSEDYCMSAQMAFLFDGDRHFKTITCPLLFSLERRNEPLFIQDVISRE